MTALLAILFRLSYDLATTAVTSAVERLHTATDTFLHSPAQRDAAREARERAAVDARCERYVKRAQAQRGCS